MEKVDSTIVQSYPSKDRCRLMESPREHSERSFLLPIPNPRFVDKNCNFKNEKNEINSIISHDFNHICFKTGATLLRGRDRRYYFISCSRNFCNHQFCKGKIRETRRRFRRYNEILAILLYFWTTGDLLRTRILHDRCAGLFVLGRSLELWNGRIFLIRTG